MISIIIETKDNLINVKNLRFVSVNSSNDERGYRGELTTEGSSDDSGVATVCFLTNCNQKFNDLNKIFIDDERYEEEPMYIQQHTIDDVETNTNYEINKQFLRG